MIDPRFYEALGPATARALSPSGDIGGDAERKVSGLAPAERAGPDDLCYYEAKSGQPLNTAPGVCVIASAAAHLAPKAGALILSDQPRAMFARIAPLLARPHVFSSPQGIDPTAKVEDGVRLAPGVVIGPGAQIGAGSIIGPNSVIGPGATIGRRACIGAGCAIGFALIGDDVSILSGTVIGEAGFGVAGSAGGLVDVPHFGRVIIQDRVSIGANTCIDRGVFDDTVIAEEAKIDNLCQIAHNVLIGRGAMIAAFGGVSGSTVIGDGVMMGGRVGLGDHRKVGERAVLAAGSIVLQDVPPGETWGGYPAKPLRQWLRETAWLNRKAAGARNGGE